MMSQFEGKTVVITGDATGIGLATAKRFAAEGARVFITGRRKAELQAAKEAIGPNASAVAADSAKSADLDRLFRQVKEEAGKIDVVFANAGGGEMLPIGAVTEAHFDDIFSRNVRGVLFTAQKALPLLSTAAPSSSPVQPQAAWACRRSVYTALRKPRFEALPGRGRRTSRTATSASMS